MLPAAPVESAPRMISYDYPNCISCHISVQGRGLLNAYGRGIDLAQSYSRLDHTGLILGRVVRSKETSETWDGRFGNVLIDAVLTSRLNQQRNPEKTDPLLFALYRQTIFAGERDQCRLNTEIGFRDSGLNDLQLGPHLTATGGGTVFVRKLLLEWRLDENGTSGQELVIGRDYLPFGLQIDDETAFILHLNHNGFYDYPLQLKYFIWNEKSLTSAFIYAPSFEERSNSREYGGGILYERYLSRNLALGIQGLAEFGEEADRLKMGAYIRWGISSKWALLAQADYSRFWNVAASQAQGDQVTAYLQLFYHHYEWLVSSVTGNYAYSDLLSAGDHLYSVRYSINARLNRNFSVGLGYAIGNIERTLQYAQQASVFATIKF